MFTFIEGYDVQETRKKAHAEGKAEGIAEIAKNLIRLGYPINGIVEITGLAHKEINELLEA